MDFYGNTENDTRVQIDISKGKEIEEYSNYIIFKDSKIYNKIRNCFIKPITNASGYCYVTLSSCGRKKNFYVHVLVAKNFIINDDPIKKTQVNHKNKIRNDNNIENLEWMTPSENRLHSEIFSY